VDNQRIAMGENTGQRLFLLLFLVRKRSRRDFGSGIPKNKRLNSSNLAASAGLKGLQVLFYQAMPRAALWREGNFLY